MSHECSNKAYAGYLAIVYNLTKEGFKKLFPPNGNPITSGPHQEFKDILKEVFPKIFFPKDNHSFGIIPIEYCDKCKYRVALDAQSELLNTVTYQHQNIYISGISVLLVDRHSSIAGYQTTNGDFCSLADILPIEPD